MIVMADCYDEQTRHRVMQSIHSRDTAPEMRVRSILHRNGYRYRVHMKALPGKPDIVLTRQRTAILVNGCFWHQHPGCKHSGVPKSNSEFWDKKLRENVTRDERVIRQLKASGWRVLVIWECQITRKKLAPTFVEELLRENDLLPMNRSSIFIQLRLFDW